MTEKPLQSIRVALASPNMDSNRVRRLARGYWVDPPRRRLREQDRGDIGVMEIVWLALDRPRGRWSRAQGPWLLLPNPVASCAAVQRLRRNSGASSPRSATRSTQARA